MIALIAVIGKWFTYDLYDRCFLSDRSIIAILWKPGLSAEPFLRNEFYFHDNKKNIFILIASH